MFNLDTLVDTLDMIGSQQAKPMTVQGLYSAYTQTLPSSLQLFTAYRSVGLDLKT